MNFLTRIPKTAKIILAIAIVLLLYGYLSRAGPYFFWESRSLGWEVLVIGVIVLLIGIIRRKKAQQRKALIERIGIGILAFYLLVVIIFSIVIPNTDAYKAAKDYLQQDAAIRNELGNVVGFGLTPGGSISVSSDSQGQSGVATISLIVKGEKKYRDMLLYLEKEPSDTNWKVKEIQ